MAEWDSERGDSSREETSIDVYDSDHELISIGAPHGRNVGRVEVWIEVRQEIQRIESPRAINRERGWANDTVSTEITGKGSS